MSRDCDLLVVGGGPAGSSLAMLAANGGARVVLTERARFPRDKVCGEFLSAEGCRVIERLGLLDVLLDRGARWMDSCRITSGEGARIDAELPDLGTGGRNALGVSRAVLDAVLLDHARSHGVEVVERCEAFDPLFRDGRVVGFRIRDVGSVGKSRELRASLVVAADGRRSVLARRLHPELCDPRRSGPHSWFGLKVHLAAASSDLGQRVELHLFDGGYAGLAVVDGQRINLCLIVSVRALRACGGSPDRLLRERVLANSFARESIADARPCSTWHSVGPLRWGARRPAASGALFVGDSAGTLDPFSGEGMSNALRAAELALPFVEAAITRGGLDDALALQYASEWRRAFAPVTRRVRRLGRLLERPALAGPALRLLDGVAGAWAPRLIHATRTGI